jgi:U3 small nucleolar RNA-associated protein 4
MGEPTTLSVHRCRFVDFTPSAITALAFPPLPLPSVKGKKRTTVQDRIPIGPLVVGHANGNIDMYEWTGSVETVEAPQAWVVRKVRVLWFLPSAAPLNSIYLSDTLWREPVQN